MAAVPMPAAAGSVEWLITLKGARATAALKERVSAYHRLLVARVFGPSYVEMMVKANFKPASFWAPLAIDEELATERQAILSELEAMLVQQANIAAAPQLPEEAMA